MKTACEPNDIRGENNADYFGKNITFIKKSLKKKRSYGKTDKSKNKNCKPPNDYISSIGHMKIIIKSRPNKISLPSFDILRFDYLILNLEALSGFIIMTFMLLEKCRFFINSPIDVFDFSHV